MTNHSLAQSYFWKASKRLRILQVLLEEKSYSDVVREAQELVELALKGMLRQVGIEPPKWHDVGSILMENGSRFPEEISSKIEELAAISQWLRNEREFSFYGDVDFIPTEEYTEAEAQRALADARKVLSIASAIIPLHDPL